MLTNFQDIVVEAIKLGRKELVRYLIKLFNKRPGTINLKIADPKNYRPISFYLPRKWAIQTQMHMVETTHHLLADV